MNDNRKFAARCSTCVLYRETTGLTTELIRSICLYFTGVNMTKTKKEKGATEEESGATEKSYQELLANINPIANPLASRKLSKKLYKCVKKGKRENLLILFN